MTYRLPDRYAGKRCRCRECGESLRVPRSQDEPEASDALASGASAEEGRRERERVRRKAASAGERSVTRDERSVTRDERSVTRDAAPVRRPEREAATARRRREERALVPTSESLHQIAPLFVAERRGGGTI